MKKILAVIIAVFIMLGLTACTKKDDNETKSYSIVAPDGAPALALGKVMSENNQFGREVTYKIVPSAKISTYVKNTNELELGDVVILPVTAASKLIGTGELYKMLGVVTHGNLFIMSNLEINSINDLKGNTIGVIGQGQVPDLTFRSILASSNISYNTSETMNPEEVSIKYYNEASEMLPALKKNAISIGLLPEPAATKLTTLNDTYSVKLNLQTLYGGNYPQAIIVAKNSVIENDNQFIKNLMSALEDSEWIKNNTDSVVDAINANLVDMESSSLDKQSLSTKVVENCNIYFEKASLSKTVVNKYISDMITVESTSAKTLADEFYYAQN